MLKDHVFHWKNVVIGNDLNAVLQAYKKNSFVIIGNYTDVFVFDTIGTDGDLGGITQQVSELSVRDSLAYDIFNSGRNPFGDKVEAIYLEEDNLLSVKIKNTHERAKVRFESLDIFDMSNAFYFPKDFDEEITNYRVFDWFDVKSGMKHELDLLEGVDDLVKKIYFFKTKRIPGSSFKDLVVESILTPKQLYDINYSDSIVRLKTMDMMKAAGIKGAKNGPKSYLSVDIRLARRQILPVKKERVAVHKQMTFKNLRSPKILPSKILRL